MARSKDPGVGLGPGKTRRWRRVLLRGLIAIGVLVAVVAGIAVWVIRALPHIAVAEIGRLTNTQIETGAFDFNRDGSVSIDGLVVHPAYETPSYDNTILRAKSVYARFSRRSLLFLAPRVTEIRIEDFIVDAQFDLDSGQWNLGGLSVNRSSAGGGPIPAIHLQRGKLRYCKVLKGKTEVVMSVPMEAQFGVGGASSQGYRFEIKTARLSGGYGESHLGGHWRPGRFEIAGGLSSSDIPSLERAWAVDVLAMELQYDKDGAYKLDLRVRDLHSKQSPEVDTFRMITPATMGQSGPLAAVQGFFARFHPSGTVGEIQFEAQGNFAKLNESEIAGKVVCKDVSVCDGRFPYALDHLTGTVEIAQSTVLLNQLSARHGGVEVGIEGWVKGYGEGRQYQYQITSDNMTLDESLYTALPAGQKRLWDAFAPSGVIHVEYRLTRASPTDKRRYVSVDLKDVAATYQRFPYPLKGLTGQLYFDRESIIATDILAQTEGYRIKLDGKVTDRHTARPVYYFSIDGDDVPLDATLGAALPEDHAPMYQQLEANGVADIRAKVFTSDDANEPGPVSFLADVSVAATSMKMGQWPLVVSDVAAETSITPNLLRVTRFNGRYADSAIRLTGAVQFGGPGRSQQYHLTVDTEKTPLDETVLGMVPEAVRRHVVAFRPTGSVDLSVDVKRTDPNEPPEFKVDVACRDNTVTHERFAFPLQNLRGTVTMDNTGVTFKRMQAEPVLQGDPNLAPALELDGRVSLARESLGEGAFVVKARDVSFTPELGDVLPKDLAGIYRELSLRGPFDADLDPVRLVAGGPEETRIEFQGRTTFKTCNLKLSGTPALLEGVLNTAGTYSTQSGLSQGRMQLAADRLVVKGKAVTGLKAEMAYDPNTGGWSAENFLGDCYGGRILGNLYIGKAGEGILQYLLTVAFNRVDLQEFLRAGQAGAASAKGYSSGVLDASLSLGARIGDGASRLGICKVDVENMQVGKVSPLAKVLSVTGVTELTDYTFERMLMDSYIKQKELLIRRFDMSGKNAAFRGAGRMSLDDGTLAMTLTARGKRLAAAEPSMFQSLTEGLSGAVMRLEVTGTADNPQVETKALPVLEDSLKILGTPR